MKQQYKELTLHEALDAKIEGREIECRQPLLEWVKAGKIMIDITFEYRIAIEPYVPEVGETVLVGYHLDIKAVFIAMDEDKYVCKAVGNVYDSYTEIKPTKQEPREGWVTAQSLWSEKDKAFARSPENLIHVKEVMR